MKKFFTSFLIMVVIVGICRAQDSPCLAIDFKPYKASTPNNPAKYMTFSGSGNLSSRLEVLKRTINELNQSLQKQGYRSYGDYFSQDFAGKVFTSNKVKEENFTGKETLNYFIKERIVVIQENVDEKKCTYKVTIYVIKST
jgi:hypothetical protein